MRALTNRPEFGPELVRPKWRNMTDAAKRAADGRVMKRKIGTAIQTRDGNRLMKGVIFCQSVSGCVCYIELCCGGNGSTW